MRQRVRADEEWERANPDYVLPGYIWQYRKIWMSRGREAERRYFFRAGPAIAVYFGIFALIGTWFTVALMFLTLAPPDNDDATTGEVVQVHSCATSSLWAMAAHNCQVEVDWDDAEIQSEDTVSVHTMDPVNPEANETLASNGSWVVPVERLDGLPAYWAAAPILVLGAWGIVLGSLHFPQHSHIRRVRDWPTY